jgi:hypothetical protein
MPVHTVIPITVFPDGIYRHIRHPGMLGLSQWSTLDVLARLDWIDPPTGIALGKVLTTFNKIPKTGADGSIIRWNYQ